MDFKHPSQLCNRTKIYTSVVIKNCWVVPCQSSVFWCFLVISFLLLGITVYQNAFTSYKFHFQIQNSLLYFFFVSRYITWKSHYLNCWKLTGCMCHLFQHLEIPYFINSYWVYVPPVSAFRNSIFHQQLLGVCATCFSI